MKSSQGFQRVPGDQPSSDVVGRPMMHLSALQQATGEARCGGGGGGLACCNDDVIGM